VSEEHDCAAEFWRVERDHRDGEPVVCPVCGHRLTCEFCGKPATHAHIDYITCATHYWQAVDNVASRGLE
jgi:hypothetical protein